MADNLGAMLCGLLGDAMKRAETNRDILKQLQTELSRCTMGFADTYPIAERGNINKALNSRLPGADRSLKDTVKGLIESGYLLTPNGLESPDGSHIVSLTPIGHRFAAYLLGLHQMD